MYTVPDIFHAFGGPGEISKAISVKPSTASEMKRRKSIPVRYWPDLVASAKRRGIRGISYETLVQLHSGAAQ